MAIINKYKLSAFIIMIISFAAQGQEKQKPAKFKDFVFDGVRVQKDLMYNTDPASGAGFLAPQYHTSGGGNSTITYNSNNQRGGLSAISNLVLGVLPRLITVRNCLYRNQK